MKNTRTPERKKVANRAALCALMLAGVMMPLPLVAADVLPEECDPFADSGTDECLDALIEDALDLEDYQAKARCRETWARADAYGDRNRKLSASAGMHGTQTDQDKGETSGHKWDYVEGDGGGWASARANKIQAHCDNAEGLQDPVWDLIDCLLSEDDDACP